MSVNDLCLPYPRIRHLVRGACAPREVARLLGDTATPQARSSSQLCPIAWRRVSYPGHGWPAAVYARDTGSREIVERDDGPAFDGEMGGRPRGSARRAAQGRWAGIGERRAVSASP